MKLDADIIRKIILTVEQSDEWVSEIEGLSENEFNYHVKQLIKDGMVDGIFQDNGQSNIPSNAIAKDLQPKGHEFAKAMISDTLWAKAKEHIIKPMSSWTIEALFIYLKANIGG